MRFSVALGRKRNGVVVSIRARKGGSSDDGEDDEVVPLFLEEELKIWRDWTARTRWRYSSVES